MDSNESSSFVFYGIVREGLVQSWENSPGARYPGRVKVSCWSLNCIWHNFMIIHIFLPVLLLIYFLRSAGYVMGNKLCNLILLLIMQAVLR
jgi:hypothetical protein